ncbi:MAG: S8 family serine peptidase [Arenimonas sp.]|nr:S8 family serine peptidase [Arenimonas sp.]
MSNMKKWGATLAFVALIAAASPASYKFLTAGKAETDRSGGSADASRNGKSGDAAMAAARSGKSSAANSAGAASGYQPGSGKVAANRLAVMPRNRLPGGGFAYNPALNNGDDVGTPAAAVETLEPGTPGTFIVLFEEPSLSSYQGGTAGIEMAPRELHGTGKGRIDTRSLEAQNYLGYLQGRQMLMEEQMASVTGRDLSVRHRMQHAVNGIVVDMTTAESKRIAGLPGVKLVEGYREYVADTDVGPALIGAPAVWAGTASQPGGATAVQGEGIIIGMIDSGINFGSPSFAGTDPVDGYVHINPLGAGVYLGSCATGADDAGRCNSKLIGGYDFVCVAPGNQCGVANVREEPGFGDTNGHGSHTASTAGGNRRDVVFGGVPLRITGVAPRANLIAYDACYTNTSTGQGLCPNVSTVASINQAVADGVDVINYSIGGGALPWNEATSLAFLSATDAGVFIATSAGNSGPGANTLGHLEPWTSATAASQHGRAGFGTLMQVTGPTPVPVGLQPVVLNNGTGGVALAATLPGTTPLRISAGIATTSDGCAAYPANTFAGSIAVVRRGTCSFSIKVNNASAAGAVAMIIANNAAGTILPSVPGTTVPAFSVSQTDGNALAAFGNANPSTTTAQISFPGVGLPNVADALAAFSSRGPAGTFNLIKPDVTAPGVDILATLAGTTLTGSEQLIGTISGTSMASPHNAGAAALIRQARPTWSVSEIKSALLMTATTQVYLEDQVTLANPHAADSGRIRVERAIRAGLVMNETTANYTAANPGTGGDPATLNLPSMARASCAPTCAFTRTFRNPGTSGGLWSLSVTGLNGTLSSSLVWIPAGGSRSVTVTINTAGIAANNAWNFGQLVLTQRLSGGSSAANSTLALPIGVTVSPPALSLPPSVSASVAQGNNGNASFNVANTGGTALNYAISTSGNGIADSYFAPRGAVSSGFRNTVYTDPATAANNAQFTADDFDLTSSTQISSLSVEGFVVSGAAFPGAASSLTFSIYPDAAGAPAGNPQSAAAAASWTFTTPSTGPGVSTAGGFLSLDLAAAFQSVTLPAGKYWLVVNTTGTFANRWAQFGSATGNGTFASISVSTTNTGAWTSNNAFPGLNMLVRGSVACGAPWLGTITPASGTIAPSAPAQSTNVVLSTSSLAAGAYPAYLCVTSNDPVRASVALPVNLTVTPTPP